MSFDRSVSNARQSPNMPVHVKIGFIANVQSSGLRLLVPTKDQHEKREPTHYAPIGYALSETNLRNSNIVE